MERRHFLKLAFGFAAGGIALAASAQAAPLMPAPLADDAKLPVNPDAQPAVTSGEEVDRLTPEEVRWGRGRGRHRGWGRRRWGWRRRRLPSQVLGLASPPSLAPPLLAPSSLLLVSAAGLLTGIKKAPRERGFCRALEISINAAASIAPHGAVGAHAAGPHHDDRSRAHHDDRGGRTTTARRLGWQPP